MTECSFADANKEKPNSQMFQTVVNDIMTQIISEMKREPCYDTVDSRMKKTFLEQLNLKTGSVEWTQFVSEVSGPLLDIISKKSKMLPLNQYEEAQRKLNIHLRNKENFERLINVFSSVCTAELSPSLAGRLVFRIATKLMDGIQTFVTRELRASKAAKTPQSPQPELVQEMSVEEERSLSEMLGNLIRESVRRDKRCSSRQRQAQSLCLKDNFTVSQNPVSFEQLLNKENWFSGDENSIVPSENASNFFHIVEKAVRSESSVHKLNTSDKVLDIILQNIEALDLWFHLTNSRLSEECSLFFMREIVGSFVKKSILLEDARKNRLEDKSRQETQAALRTHLLRNYKPTDSEDIDSPSAP